MVVFAAIVTAVAAGLPLTLAIDRSERGPALLGLSYLYGAGAVWAVLSLLSVFHLQWSAVSATAALLGFSAVMWVVVVRRGRTFAAPDPVRRSPLGIAIDLATAYALVAYTMDATIARVGSWDFWAIWGLKARVFVENGGIDWPFLASPFNDFTHPDYPLLVPMNYAYAALLNGGWDDRWLGLVWMAFTVALVLVVRSLAARELSDPCAALAGFIAAGVALSRHVGLADAALIAYGGTAILMIRRYLLFDDAAALRHGAILLGLAASTKNEGVALVATVVLALAVHRLAGAPEDRRVLGRELLRLWPAVAIAAPWLLMRSLMQLQTDIGQGSFLARAAERLPATAAIVAGLLRLLPDPWIWLFLLIGVALMTRETRTRERFTFAAVAIQLFWYVATYFGTPRDVVWHLETSWPRVARHMMVPLAFVVIVALAQALPRRQTLAHAEARPDLH